ncbi:conserved exported hypothetical protein [uncultured Eubacteriales bacterium]|uniref:Division initiation protein n=1 Tax=uncultured Eubacteriales bacterium TaxID=172733 RepID=A0A212J956_9FIRM|nr:conserved exported hypothetical protein [uncultured Eubacteriales bacterium]
MEKAKKNRGELAIGVVCVLLGVLLAVQLRSVKVNNADSDAQSGRLETLQGMYNEARDKLDSTQAQLESAQAELQKYRDEAASGSGGNEALRAEVDKLEMEAGLTEVVGPGVMVAMRDSTAANVTGDEQNYLIHDSDLLAVINDLRDAGAEAISLNGERLLATSEVRCAGAVVIVNGRRYAAPFVINAIGDSATLYNALTMRNGVVDVLGQWKIEVKVTASEMLTVPGYNGVLDFQYAQPAATLPPEEEGGAVG